MALMCSKIAEEENIFCSLLDIRENILLDAKM